MFSTGVSSSTGAGAAPRGQTPFGDLDFLPSPQPASVSSSQSASFTNENAAADATEPGWGEYIDLLYQLDSPAGLDPRSWYAATAVCPDCHVILTRRHFPLHAGTAFCGAANHD